MEGFRSEVQKRLFASDNADEFMSGLSRAFTLNSDRHEVGRERPADNDRSTAEFRRMDGVTFRVTVERVGA